MPETGHHIVVGL